MKRRWSSTSGTVLASLRESGSTAAPLGTANIDGFVHRGRSFPGRGLSTPDESRTVRLERRFLRLNGGRAAGPGTRRPGPGRVRVLHDGGRDRPPAQSGRRIGPIATKPGADDARDLSLKGSKLVDPPSIPVVQRRAEAGPHPQQLGGNDSVRHSALFAELTKLGSWRFEMK